MSMNIEVLRQVLEARGLNFDDVMREVLAEQKIVGLMRTIGKSMSEILGGAGYATIEVIVSDGKVTVSISGSVKTRQIEFDLTPNNEASQSQGKSRDGKGPKIVGLLEEAASRFGIKLKEWQKRSVAFHFPNIAKSLIKETKNAILDDASFKEAVRLYAEWHPERQNELPQI